MCHVSHGRCQKSHFFFTKWWRYSVDGLLSTRPAPSSCRKTPTIMDRFLKNRKNVFFSSSLLLPMIVWKMCFADIINGTVTVHWWHDNNISILTGQLHSDISVHSKQCITRASLVCTTENILHNTAWSQLILHDNTWYLPRAYENMWITSCLSHRYWQDVNATSAQGLGLGLGDQNYTSSQRDQGLMHPLELGCNIMIQQYERAS